MRWKSQPMMEPICPMHFSESIYYVNIYDHRPSQYYQLSSLNGEFTKGRVVTPKNSGEASAADADDGPVPRIGPR